MSKECEVICKIVTLKTLKTQFWKLRLSVVLFIIHFLTTIRLGEHTPVIPEIVSQT